MSNPFASWTEADVAAHNARLRMSELIDCGGDPETPPGPESNLHSEILKECKRRGWIALHGSMAHRSHRTLGEFDFVILADCGRVFLVECKSKTGKLTPDQAALHHWAKNLGHDPRVVRSLAEFEEVVR